MKKLTKQQLLQQQTHSPAPPGTTSATQGPPSKKKSKTASNSFTPHTKSAANSEMHIPLQRYSIGTNETPLAMNKNYEYFASTASGVAAQTAAQRQIGIGGGMHKHSNSQLPSNIYTSEHSNQHPTGIAAASVKNSNKISTLKNKAAFEKYHPSQQLTISNQHSGMNVISTKDGSMTQHNSMSKGNNSHQSSVATMQTSQQNSMSIVPSGAVQHNPAVMSKLNHYQKMSSGPQKRTYVRGSSKKNQHHEHGITSTHVMPAKMHISSNHIDDKVKKSSSQSLIKIQAAQMIGSQAKEFSTAVKEEPRQTKQLKNMGHQTGSKKTFEGANPSSAAKDMSSSTSKKLIFSFKKESKQKVTPPNVQNTAAPSKPHLVGHHRRVQSHGQAIANFNLKTEQPSTKIHSPKVEKASHHDMISSHQTSTIQGGQTDAASSGKGIPVTQQFLHHPALSKHYKQEYQLNKSKTSGGVSHSSLNGSRDQVSILSLNSFSRSTPKFTQVLSLPQSVLNYQAHMSRANNIPAKMLSPQSQTQVKQSMNQVKSVAVREKKATVSGNAVPNEGTHGTLGVERGVKKIGKIQKHQKLRLKHTQSTVQPSNTGANMVQNNIARQCSPEVLGNNGRDATKTDHSQKAQVLPTFDLKQMSSRNGATKSQGSIKEQASPFQPQSTQHSQYLSNTIQQMSLKDQNLDGTPKQLKMDTIKEGFHNNAQQQDTEAQLNNHGSHAYKVMAKHQKSQSYGQPVSQPGIYNMYMGQVNQLKKQRISLNKAGATNNTQPTHFINLNADQTGGLINQNASLESLKKNSSHLQATSSNKIKMSVTGKAPNKLHLTTPPSAHDEKSQNDLNVMQEQSLSQDQDNNQQSFREALPNQPRANLVPQSLLQTNGTAHQHHQSLKMTQNTINSNSNANIMTSKLQTTQNQQNNNSSLQPTKSLTLKHKQLAKAIKQQHHAMIRQPDGVQQPPMTSKAMSTSTGPMLGVESELRSEKQLFINATISPKSFQRKIQNHSQTLQSPNQNIVPHQTQTSQIQPKRMSHDNQIQPVEYLSERKRKTMGRMNHLDPLGVGERQKCWQSPAQGKSSISDKDASGLIPDPDFVQSNGVTNIMNQEGGQKSQQISAAIIKKIQNNYQVQVTNGYDSSMTTESAKALQSITQKIKNENTSVLPYLHALQEISEIYPNNNPLNTLLSQIHQGISTMILTKEDQIQQSQQSSKIMSKKLVDQEDLLQQAREQIQNLETNEEETRRHVHAMTQQIDDRDAKIEKLEQQILGHNKRARLMFKKQMASRAERPQLDLIFDGNCSELERQSDERRKVFQENEELQSAIDELNEDMAYGKQRENKLMFFLYILKQMGYPISEVFEREIKDVPTSRFSKNFDDEYKVMHAQLWKERREAKKELKLIQQNGFGIDRDEILIESVPKTDRLIPMSVQNGFNIRRYSDNRLPSGEVFDDDDDLNFYPLHVGPIQEQRRPDKVPALNINKVLIIKHRRAKGLSVSNLINKTDSMDHQSQSSDESLDSRGRPKRCPKPRLHKRILDQYGVQTGARNIMALESQVFKQKIQELMRNSNTSELLAADDELRYSLNSQRAESMQSQRI